jgi:hypothetical protein
MAVTAVDITQADSACANVKACLSGKWACSDATKYFIDK